MVPKELLQWRHGIFPIEIAYKMEKNETVDKEGTVEENLNN